MSSMLEQAIVDANALREVARKNAEQSVLEKYSTEIKKAVDTLLEAKEEKASPLMPDMEGLMTSPDLESAVSNAASTSNVNVSATKKETFGGVKDSYKTKTDEMVKISFSALEEALELEEGWHEKELEEDYLVGSEEEEEEAETDEGFDMAADPAYGRDSDVSIGGIDEGDLETAFELEEGDAINMPDVPSTTQIPETGTNIAADSDSLEELDELELDEFELDEELYGETGNLSDSLAEAIEEELDEVLNVDMSLSNQGHLGFSRVHYKEQEKILKALQAAEENLAKSKKREKNLQEEFVRLRDVVTQLTEAYTDLRTQFLDTVKLSDQVKNENEKIVIENKKLSASLKQMVVSNGKLLYTNKVLGNPSLNERQKHSLVEAISNSDSVEKAKVIYETLQSGTQGVTKKTPESLSEAIRKAPSPYYTQRSTQQATSSPLVERMQILAGIKK